MTTTIGSDAVADQAPAAWVIPTVRHDDNRPVGPRIHGGWIHRAAGQSDPEHTRHYAALLLAAADEAERRMADAQHTPITDRETEMNGPTALDALAAAGRLAPVTPQRHDTRLRDTGDRVYLGDRGDREG